MKVKNVSHSIATGTSIKREPKRSFRYCFYLKEYMEEEINKILSEIQDINSKLFRLEQKLEIRIASLEERISALEKAAITALEKVALTALEKVALLSKSTLEQRIEMLERGIKDKI